MTATTKVKLSGPMFEALDLFRQNDTAILFAYFIRTGTAVALMRRGLISAERRGRYQLLPAGARQLSIDYTIFVERARDAALAEDADRVVCIAPGCGEAFTSGRRYNYDPERTATQRMRLHAAAAHVPTSVIGWVSLGKPLTDEQWETVRAYLDSQAPRAAANRARVANLLSATVAKRATVEAPAAIESPKPTAEDLLLDLAKAARDGMPVGTGLTFTHEGGLSVQLTRDSVDQLDLWAGYLNAPVVDGGKINGWRHFSVNGTLHGHPIEVWTAQY